MDYLEWLRWPAGFVCAACSHDSGWRLGDGRYRCSGCGGRTSVIAGTIFDRTRTPLTVWFTASWLFAASKDGISALSLQRTLEISGTLPGLIATSRAPGRATHAAVCARAPADLGTPSSESPLENRGVKLVRLNGYSQTRLRHQARAACRVEGSAAAQ